MIYYPLLMRVRFRRCFSGNIWVVLTNPVVSRKLIYTLRKNGRIEVNEHWSGMVLGEYEWANDALIFKSEGEAAGSNYRVLAATENPEGDRLQIIGVDLHPPASLPLNRHISGSGSPISFKSGKHGFIWATPGSPGTKTAG